jgi:hypothetical protein
MKRFGEVWKSFADSLLDSLVNTGLKLAQGSLFSFLNLDGGGGILGGLAKEIFGTGQGSGSGGGGVLKDLFNIGKTAKSVVDLFSPSTGTGVIANLGNILGGFGVDAAASPLLTSLFGVSSAGTVPTSAIAAVNADLIASGLFAEFAGASASGASALTGTATAASQAGSALTSLSSAAAAAAPALTVFGGTFGTMAAIRALRAPGDKARAGQIEERISAAAPAGSILNQVGIGSVFGSGGFTNPLGELLRSKGGFEDSAIIQQLGARLGFRSGDPDVQNAINQNLAPLVGLGVVDAEFNQVLQSFIAGTTTLDQFTAAATQATAAFQSSAEGQKEITQKSKETAQQFVDRMAARATSKEQLDVLLGTAFQLGFTGALPDPTPGVAGFDLITGGDATGRFVTRPSLRLIGEGGPEHVFNVNSTQSIDFFRQGVRPILRELFGEERPPWGVARAVEGR